MSDKTFKPGDKVLVYLADSQKGKLVPNPSYWGVVGTYTRHSGKDNDSYPHDVHINGQSYPCHTSEIQLLEDE